MEQQEEHDFKEKWLKELPHSPTLKKWDCINFTTTCLSCIAAVITITIGVISYFQSDNTLMWQEIIYILGLCTWILGISAFLFWYCYKRTIFCTRISGLNFSSVMDYTHFVNHIIRDHIAKSCRGDQNTPELSETLELIVTSIAECFSIVTGHRCRCCIKDVSRKKEENNGEITEVVYVATTCRDKATLTMHRYSPNTAQELKDNTDFVSIFTNKQRFYCCGDLQQEYDNHKYKNSTTNWHLFYQSAFVVPIRADFSQSLDDCHGFLCLDSQDKNVFNDPCFIELAGSFADILYSLTVIVKQLENTPKKQPPRQNTPKKRKPIKGRT